MLFRSNVVFWEHRLFVELSHFHASLSSSSVLNLFPDEAHIPNPSVATPDPLVVVPNPPVATPDHPVVAPDSPVDFSIQPPDILDPFPSSPFNEQVEDELPNPKLGSPTPAPPDDHAQDIPARHSTRVRSTPAHLLDYHCYTARASNLS